MQLFTLKTRLLLLSAILLSGICPASSMDDISEGPRKRRVKRARTAAPVTNEQPILRQDAETKPRFREYSTDAPPVEQWMFEVLDKPVVDLDFPGDTPLAEILSGITAQVTRTYGSETESAMKMTILPDRGELALELIDSLDDVLISDVQFDRITLRNAFDHIFDQTHDDAKCPVPLTWVIHNEVLLITTERKAMSESFLAIRTYDVGHIIAASEEEPIRETEAAGDSSSAKSRSGAGLFSIQFGDASEASSNCYMGCAGATCMNCMMGFNNEQSELVQLVVDMTINGDGDNWSAPYGNGVIGQISLYGNKLVVRQTPAVHRNIVKLLNLVGKQSSN